MATWRWLLSAALAASAISSVATVQAEENKDEGPVSIDDIPAPAQDAIMSHVGTGMLMGVVEETGQRGEPVYEGRIRRGGRNQTITVDAAGNILDMNPNA